MAIFILVEKDYDHNLYIRRVWAYSSFALAHAKRTELGKDSLPCFVYEIYSSEIDSGILVATEDYAV